MAALRALRTCFKGTRTPAAWECLRPLRVCSSGTDPRRGSEPAGTGSAAEPEGPEYIPRKKAKSPMTKVAYAWMVGLPSGIIGFVLVKRRVDQNRLEQLKIRQRMRTANE
ncbi:DUF4748 domain-containing protein [Brachionichthys hirsutus]|uniref:DUF4748 domain-containing protein n=1 Tax=Brachionichthys hirsutus TaxID=412623 RepID=UPI0036051E95